VKYLCHRKGVFGDGTYALPGGKLELGESFHSCASRELEEETALQISGDFFSFHYAVNAVFPTGEHYVAIFMRAEVESTARAEVKNMEPEKNHGWDWVPISSLESLEPLFLPLKKALDEGGIHKSLLKQ